MIEWCRGWLATRHRWVQAATGRWATAVWLVVGIVILIVASSLVGLVLAWQSPTPVGTIDLAVAEWAAQHRVDGLTAFFWSITDLGDTITLLILSAGVGVVWRWRRGDWTGMEALVGSWGGALVVYSVVKRIVGRARPPVELALGDAPGWSFPSGHTTGSAAVYTALVLLVVAIVGRQALRWAIVAGAGIVVVLIAASRVYLGVHWAADVVAGLFIGSAWACWVVTPLDVRRRQRGEPVTEQEAGRADAPT